MCFLGFRKLETGSRLSESFQTQKDDSTSYYCILIRDDDEDGVYQRDVALWSTLCGVGGIGIFVFFTLTCVCYCDSDQVSFSVKIPRRLSV